jgi:hypothetical protein
MQHFINLNMKSLSVWASFKDTLFLNSSSKALAQYKFLIKIKWHFPFSTSHQIKSAHVPNKE